MGGYNNVNSSSFVLIKQEAVVLAAVVVGFQSQCTYTDVASRNEVPWIIIDYDRFSW